MGPFPHDAAPPEISEANPMGTDGFEFVEFAHPAPEKLDILFRRMGFTPVARHRSRDITLYRQGDINYLLNREPDSHASRFVAAHGPCAPAMAWRVVDARQALKRAPIPELSGSGAVLQTGSASEKRDAKAQPLVPKPAPTGSPGIERMSASALSRVGMQANSASG